ncbi:MAG: alkylhydroperoxidase domain protein [Bifidobacteriaceae bacterium]|jgi:alkylhydroperoxidase domain protein/CMD domain protein|nr:alkylhydroperoxidase domain protein [Bifidobacteriaceae bacterium]
MSTPVITRTPDLVAAWAGIAPAVAAERRPQTREQTRASHEALFEPLDDTAFPVRERWLVASFATALTAGDAVARYYAAGATAVDQPAAAVIAEEAKSAWARGPYGRYAEAELSRLDAEGPRYQPSQTLSQAVGRRLAAALEHTHLLVLRPREADSQAIRRLSAAGWSADGIVTLSQLVAFLSYEQRVAHGLRLISELQAPHAGAPASEPRLPSAGLSGPDGKPAAAGSAPGQSAQPTEVMEHTAPRPRGYTRERLDWLPWLEPLAKEELTERHQRGLVDASRAESDYFRLLVRDPEVLRARTLADKDIFYNTTAGLPRAEREFVAVATSRTNGCVFCASVHAHFAAHYSNQPELIDRLLEDGPEKADLPERWRLIAQTAAALTRTPIGLTAAHVKGLADMGLSSLEIADVVHAAAFFNWANRLMLSLGRVAAGPQAASDRAHWQARREAYWGDRFGPTTLVGTWWLDSAPRRLPAAPGRWWSDGGRVLGADLADAASAQLTDGAELVAGGETGRLALPAGAGVELDGKRLVAYARGEALALRVLDPESERARSFGGVEVAPWDSAWAVPAVFTPAPEGAAADQEHVDGFTVRVPVAGSFDFELEGRPLRLSARGAGGRYHIVFGDSSNEGNSPPFRFLRVEAPAGGGAAVLDFNTAELPPCAFSEHYLCPLPLPGNRLEVAIEAGELRPRWTA